MTDEIDQRISAAHRKVSEIRTMRQTEIDDATAAINAKYATDLAAARAVLAEAVQAERDHVDATASHPWDGKRVYRERPKYASAWSSKQVGVERLDGILEVVRQSSQFPANMTYSRPKLGTIIIRKLKKDGSVSLATHDILGRDPESAGWKLAE